MGHAGEQGSLGRAAIGSGLGIQALVHPRPLIGQPFHEINIAATPGPGNPTYRVVFAEMTPCDFQVKASAKSNGHR